MASKYLDNAGLTYFWGKLKEYFQPKLVSGTNIKTINNQSLLGSGNISISGSRSVKTYSGTSDANGLLLIPASYFAGDKPMIILYATGAYLTLPYKTGNYYYCRAMNYQGSSLPNTAITITYLG